MPSTEPAEDAAPRSGRALGLYVHLPFCAVSCPYCDYAHTATPPRERQEAFVEALCAEVRRRSRFHGAPAATLYLGGGTPSQLAPAGLERVLGALRGAFDFGGVQEITLEANPDDLARPWLEAVRALGVDRLSLGVQSFSEADLRTLGRRHDADEAAQAVPLARAAGFANVSVDLLFGLPGQSPGRWRATLGQAVRQAPEHVTLYRLTAPPGTPLGRRAAAGTAAMPAADAAAAQYADALDALGAAGYRLYEQTHLARPGFAGRHTPRYWRHAGVLGFGPGAHSLWWNADQTAAFRRANAAREDAYTQALTGGEEAPHTREQLAPRALAGTYVAHRLRTAEGLSLERLARRYGRDLRAARGPVIDRLQAEGYLEEPSAGRLRPTRAGRLHLDAMTDALL